jgi:hypothetical protein
MERWNLDWIPATATSLASDCRRARIPPCDKSRPQRRSRLGKGMAWIASRRAASAVENSGSDLDSRSLSTRILCSQTLDFLYAKNRSGFTRNPCIAGPAQYYTTPTIAPLAQVPTKDPVSEPINPARGNVYREETDIKLYGSGTIEFVRFYNSADTTGYEGVPGWRHSYSRSVSAIYQISNRN